MRSDWDPENHSKMAKLPINVLRKQFRQHTIAGFFYDKLTSGNQIMLKKFDLKITCTIMYQRTMLLSLTTL